MVRKSGQKEGLVDYLIKGCLIPLTIVCLTVVQSFAETHDFIQKLDALSKIKGSFTFAAIGDTRSGGDDYRVLVQRIMEYRPDFVVNTGDMVNFTNKTHWAKFSEESKAISVPYFLTVGNHDVHDEKSEELYKEQVDLPGNKLYYSFTVSDSLFIFLDSNIPGQDRKITGEQYKWLEQVLLTSSHTHKFVFVHHPLYPEKGIGWHYGGSLDKHPKERDRLQTLFVKYKVTMVFTGHEHIYLRKKVDGVTHIITGGGGALLYADEAEGGFYHFILLTVDENQVKGEVIDIKGNVKDTFQLYYQKAAYVSPMIYMDSSSQALLQLLP